MPTILPPPLAKLETRLGLAEGALESTDKTRAEDALADASTLVLAEVADATATRWTDAAPDVVALVVLKAARREYENPRGIYQETRGEHSVGLSESSGVYLTAREVEQVRRAATKRRSGVGSIRTPSAYASDTSPVILTAVSDGSAPVNIFTVEDTP